MEFYDLVTPISKEENRTYTPFATKLNGVWLEGSISIDYLNDNFGHLETVEEMKNATRFESYKKYFDWLKEQGILN